MYRALLCAALALVPAASEAAFTGPYVYTVPADPRIVLVDCGRSRGSAVRVSAHLYLSVNHVTSEGGCVVNGERIKIVSVDKDHDFSIFRLSQAGEGWFPVDCRGFVAGRNYTAVGHARGLQQLTGVALIATGEYINGFSRLDGITTVIPGQSGGMIGADGAIIGMVNVYNMGNGLSGSTALKDTEVCRNA